MGIRDGRIAAIGRLGGAVGQRTIDAKQMIVAPDFIDMLGQSELTIDHLRNLGRGPDWSPTRS